MVWEVRLKNILSKYVKGYIKIRLESSMPERFISLCAKNQIELWNLNYEDLYYTCELHAKDFFRIAPFRRKTASHITVLEKHGLPFFFQFALKRKAFFLGILLFFLILYTNSTILWDIQVNGNQYYSKETILEELYSFQIHSGIPKKALNCQEIAASIRNSFPNVVWVSAKLDGCCLFLDIKENENPNVDTETTETDSWNLIAKKDGEIVKIVTRSGMPLVSEGMECKKGDILVQGMVEILNQDMEVGRMEYVQADADILMKTKHAYYDEFSLEYTQKIYTEPVRQYPVIRIFDKELAYLPDSVKDKDIYIEEQPLFLTDSFPLPLSFGTITIRPYHLVTKNYTSEEAQTLANEHLQKFMEQLTEEDIIVLEKHLQFTIQDHTCQYKGYLTVLESAVAQESIF